MIPADGGSGGKAPKIDKALAEEVVNQARAAMTMLASQTPTRTSKGRLALEHWNGNYADTFRSDFSKMQRDAHNLHGQLQALIRQVTAAMEAK